VEPNGARATPARAVVARAATAFMMAASLTLLPACGRANGLGDSVATEIRHWSDYVRTHPAGSDDWKQVKDATEPILARATFALDRGMPLLALQRLAAAQTYLAASVYMEQQVAAGHADSAGFEAEWARMGRVFAPDLGPPRASDFGAIGPTALRALAETARPQLRAYYEASLEFGRSTQPQYGLFYIGQALAQGDFIGFCRRASAPAPGSTPPVRGIEAELDSLETELLAAYRPPASIDHHPEFISISAALKEARELNGAGLHNGALLRYLQAAQRFAVLRGPASAIDTTALRARLREWGTRLDGGGVDHSIGDLFLELARAEDAAAGADSVAPAAAAIVLDVLPRYFAALGPAPPVRPRPVPQTTVTLVRWPYT
jgi:hypothetical protein